MSEDIILDHSQIVLVNTNTIIKYLVLVCYDQPKLFGKETFLLFTEFNH